MLAMSKYIFFFKFVIFVCFILDINVIDVSRNRNNLKLKVKSEFSLSMGLMLINHRALLVERRTFSYDKHRRALLCSVCNLTVAQSLLALIKLS